MDSRQWNNAMNNAISSLGICAKVCKSVLDEKDTDEILDKMENIAKKYCQLDIEHTANIEAIELTQEYYLAKDKNQMIPVDKMYDTFYRTMPKPTDKRIKDHKLFTKFLFELDEISASDEESSKDADVIPENQFVPPIDPISKTTIRNPVKSSECGHVYEKETIITIISAKSLRCPYIGCPVMQYIEPSHLIDDIDLKRKIDNYFLSNV